MEQIPLNKPPTYSADALPGPAAVAVFGVAPLPTGGHAAAVSAPARLAADAAVPAAEPAALAAAAAAASLMDAGIKESTFWRRC